jgi:hypothetical protein
VDVGTCRRGWRTTCWRSAFLSWYWPIPRNCRRQTNRIGYFMQAEPDVLLTEIHRQAADNPILRLADQIRRGVLAFATTPAGHTRGSAG